MIARKVRDIEYQLLPGTERKTTDIVIERDGAVVVRPPAHYGPEQVDEVVESKRQWIYQNLAEWRDLNASAVVREWVSGETFLYLGRNYRLKFVSDQERPLMLKEGWFCLDRSCMERGGPAGAREAFRQFYIDRGRARIPERVAHFAPKVGVEPAAIRVKEMGNRWASCGTTGNLNFHWKCLMAPSRILDYIVVHELCHFHTRDHSDTFWNEVDKVMPDYRERKDWLRRRGAAMEI